MAGSTGGMSTRAATVKRVLRDSFACLLVLAFLGSLAWILLGWPLPFTLWIALAVVAGGSLTAFLTFFVPNGLSERLRRALTAGAACTGLIAAVIAVPAIQDAGTSHEESQTDASLPGAAASTEAASPTAEPDPLTATLQFGEDCEGFVLPNSLLRELPKNKDITAKWAYEHGGATSYGVGFLLLQGTSEDAVILQGMRVIELARASAPSNTSEVMPCSASGGFIRTRYFDVELSQKPKIIPRTDPESGAPQPKFPFKVSNSDPEYFELWVKGPPCLCSWRIALDWTSRGRSGTLVVDRGFSTILTNTLENLPSYQYDEGRWKPPLPK